MFKRRVMVLSAVGVLGLSALAGSAMADEAPTGAPGDKVVCTTSEGKVVELAPANTIAIGPDGKIVEGEALPEPPEGATGFKGQGKIIEFKEAVPATPAQPAEEVTDAVPTEPGDGPVLSQMGTPPAEGAKAFSIKCVKKQ